MYRCVVHRWKWDGKYAALSNTGDSINELMADMPSSLQAIMGIGSLDLATVDGYFGLLYLYLVIMASIHAAMLGATMISKEERDKTAEFLFVKPISRTTVITAKLGASIVIVIVFNLVTLLSSIVFVDFFNTGDSVTCRSCTINGWNVHDAASLFISLGGCCGLCEKAKVVYPDINGHLVGHIYYVCWN